MVSLASMSSQSNKGQEFLLQEVGLGVQDVADGLNQSGISSLRIQAAVGGSRQQLEDPVQVTNG